MKKMLLLPLALLVLIACGGGNEDEENLYGRYGSIHGIAESSFELQCGSPVYSGWDGTNRLDWHNVTDINAQLVNTGKCVEWRLVINDTCNRSNIQLLSLESTEDQAGNPSRFRSLRKNSDTGCIVDLNPNEYPWILFDGRSRTSYIRARYTKSDGKPGRTHVRTFTTNTY